MSDGFGAANRRKHLKKIAGDIEKSARESANEGIADLRSRGDFLGGIGQSPIVREILTAARRLIPAAIEFDQDAASYELERLSIDKECTNPFEETRERELYEAVERLIGRLAVMIGRSGAFKSLWLAYKTVARDVCHAVVEEARSEITVEYSKLRTWFDLKERSCRQRLELELRAPLGWEGDIPDDLPEAAAQVGEWLQRELAGLLLLGEKGRSHFWIEQSNILVRNTYRLFDCLKVRQTPGQPGDLTDPNEIERTIRALAHWCNGSFKAIPVAGRIGAGGVHEALQSQPLSMLEAFPDTPAGHLGFIERVRDEVHYAAEAKQQQFARGYENATIESMVRGIKWVEARTRLSALTDVPTHASESVARALRRELTPGTVEQIDNLLAPTVRALRNAFEDSRETVDEPPHDAGRVMDTDIDRSVTLAGGGPSGDVIKRGGGSNANTSEEPLAASKKQKRSTNRNEAQVKLIAVLRLHHKYADGSCLHLEPIGNNKLAESAGVTKSTASEFLKKHFGSWSQYRVVCRNNEHQLAMKLAVLSGDAQRRGLANFGRLPPNEGNDEEA